MAAIPPLPSDALNDRQRVILNATLELISLGGVDSVTHRRVAKHADIPLGSTTYYFDSREHLIRAAFDRYLEWQRSLRDQIPTDPSTSVDAAVDFLCTFVAREAEARAMLVIEYEMTLFAARDDGLASALNAWFDAVHAQLAQSMTALGATDADGAARSVLQLLRGHQLDALTRRGAEERDLRQRLHRLISSYV